MLRKPARAITSATSRISGNSNGTIPIGRSRAGWMLFSKKSLRLSERTSAQSDLALQIESNAPQYRAIDQSPPHSPQNFGFFGRSKYGRSMEGANPEALMTPSHPRAAQAQNLSNSR